MSPINTNSKTTFFSRLAYVIFRGKLCIISLYYLAYFEYLLQNEYITLIVDIDNF